MTVARAPFDVGRALSRLRERGTGLGEPLTWLDETTSTNDLALEGARQGAPHGATWGAEAQTQGRGRRGRAWSAQRGESLLFTVLLRPALPPGDLSQMALVAGLSVRAAAARRTKEPLRVKWPNDVVAGRRKLSGILVESRLDGSRVDALVVGVGVNVHAKELPADLAHSATSLALLGDEGPDRELLLADILMELAARLDLLTTGQHARLFGELRSEDALLGEQLVVGDLSGVGAGIDESGALLLRDGSGMVHAVTSGSVERR